MTIKDKIIYSYLEELNEKIRVYRQEIRDSQIKLNNMEYLVKKIKSLLDEEESVNEN